MTETLGIAPRRAAGWGQRLQASERRVLLAAGDFTVAALAVAVSIVLWTITAGVGPAEALSTKAPWFLAAIAWGVGLAPARRSSVALSVAPTLAAVTRLAAALLVVYLVVYFYAPRQALPRLLALYFAWEASLLTVGWRLLHIWLSTEGGIARRLLIAGGGESALAIVGALREANRPDLLVVGLVNDDPASANSGVGSLEVLGGLDSLPEAAIREHVSQIILAARLDEGRMVDSLLRCEEAGIRVVPMAVMYEQVLNRVPVQHVGPEWLFTSYAEAVSARDASELAKRFVDLVGGLAGTLLLAALLPFIGLAIWLDSGLPVFYRQTRVGRGGRIFQLTKFRTMVADAEADGQPRWAGIADPRVTRVGRWLRRTRLDELPNVLAILRGDLSLVGPRPEREEFVAALQREIPMYRARLTSRPGLTGWAQINYPYGDSVADAVAKLEYDLYYLKHRSLSFDLWIALRTVMTILSFGGR